MRIGQPNSPTVYHFSQRPSLILTERSLEVPHAYFVFSSSHAGLNVVLFI